MHRILPLHCRSHLGSLFPVLLVPNNYKFYDATMQEDTLPQDDQLPFILQVCGYAEI